MPYKQKHNNRKTKTGRRPRPLVQTNRPLHRKALLHPVSLFMLLCTGVFLAFSTIQSLAANINVHAKVSAPYLTVPAVITQPADGTEVSNIPITVAGTCPDNAYVTLSRNNLFSGVADCSNGTFSISTDLFIGANQLIVQDYNSTDDAGPASQPITVTFNPPRPLLPTQQIAHSGTSSDNGKNASPVSTSGPLLLIAAFRYEVFHAGTSFQWTVGISGGEPPYTVHKAWGDGSAVVSPIGNTSEFTISHTYSMPGSYVIKLDAADARGNRAMLQLIAIVDSGSSPATATNSGSTISNSGGASQPWLWIALPAYGIVVLMAISFYLGEREEMRQLHSRPRRRWA